MKTAWIALAAVMTLTAGLGACNSGDDDDCAADCSGYEPATGGMDGTGAGATVPSEAGSSGAGGATAP